MIKHSGKIEIKIYLAVAGLSPQPCNTVFELRQIKNLANICLGLQPLWHEWVARWPQWAASNATNDVGSSFTQIAFFHEKNYKSSKTQFILLSKLALGLG